MTYGELYQVPYLSVTDTASNLFLLLHFFCKTYQGTYYARVELYNQDQVMWSCLEAEGVL